VPILLLFAFVAGGLTILSPCILPVAALLVGSTALAGGARRVVGIVAGFAATFTATTVLLAATLAAAGLTSGALRVLAAATLAVMGAAALVPQVGDRVAARLGPLLGPRAVAMSGEPGRGRGITGGILVGAGIGLAWAPCVGPIMGAVIAASVIAGPSPESAAVALAYSVGAAVPLVLLALAGRRAVGAMGSPERRARLTRGFGALVLGGGLLIASGLDVPFETGVSNVLPAGWSSIATSVEAQPAVEKRLDELASPGSAASASQTRDAALGDLGPAPELAGISAWINSTPLSLTALRGKVVLVHFWTFACINCLHVQPYVEAWYRRYAAAGFVVLGVHTPELSFERDVANVRDAVARDGVTFPVAFDPSFATWNAYQNRYWPAFYFVDRHGTIRHVHFGEGDYSTSERVIQELLAEPA
jgi:cytochrome c biogenesis protein CcdA/thiol-disulfide isomerase/thioredoxin